MATDPLRRLLDLQAIGDLVHEYCIRVDRYEPEGVAELFFEDALVDYGPSLGGAERGREPLAKKLRSGLGQFEGTHHQVSNLQVRFESDDRATAISYVTAWHGVPGDGPDLTVYGQYHDVLERRQGRWGFSERRILVSGDSGSPVAWNRTPRSGRD